MRPRREQDQDVKDLMRREEKVEGPGREPFGTPLGVAVDRLAVSRRSRGIVSAGFAAGSSQQSPTNVKCSSGGEPCERDPRGCVRELTQKEQQLHVSETATNNRDPRGQDTHAIAYDRMSNREDCAQSERDEDVCPEAAVLGRSRMRGDDRRGRSCAMTSQLEVMKGTYVELTGREGVDQGDVGVSEVFVTWKIARSSAYARRRRSGRDPITVEAIVHQGHKGPRDEDDNADIIEPVPSNGDRLRMRNERMVRGGKACRSLAVVTPNCANVDRYSRPLPRQMAADRRKAAKPTVSNQVTLGWAGCGNGYGMPANGARQPCRPEVIEDGDKSRRRYAAVKTAAEEPSRCVHCDRSLVSSFGRESAWRQKSQYTQC